MNLLFYIYILFSNLLLKKITMLPHPTRAVDVAAWSKITRYIYSFYPLNSNLYTSFFIMFTLFNIRLIKIILFISMHLVTL